MIISNRMMIIFVDKKDSVSLVDEVLRDCEALKLATVAILERCSDSGTDVNKSQGNVSLSVTKVVFTPYVPVFFQPCRHNFRDIELKFCIFHNLFHNLNTAK